MKKEFFSTQTPLGETLSLYKNFWEGPELSETLAIVSGLQGDRLNGLIAASRLSRFLGDIAQGRKPEFKITGNIQIFPIVNLPALSEGSAAWSYDNLDADRAFPGLEEGDLTETLCHAVLQQTAQSDYGIILQTAEPHYTDAPHIKMVSAHLKSLARNLDLRVAREIAEFPALTLQLIKQWDALGMAAFILSAGTPGVVDPAQSDILFESVLNFMLVTGFLSHTHRKGHKRELDFYPAKNECTLLTKYSGIFLPKSKVGNWMSVDQPLGEVVDLYSGEVLETVTAREEGFLVTLRMHPLVHEKEPVAVLLTRKSKRWFWPFS